MASFEGNASKATRAHSYLNPVVSFFCVIRSAFATTRLCRRRPPPVLFKRILCFPHPIPRSSRHPPRPPSYQNLVCTQRVPKPPKKQKGRPRPSPFNHIQAPARVHPRPTRPPHPIHQPPPRPAASARLDTRHRARPTHPPSSNTTKSIDQSRISRASSYPRKSAALAGNARTTATPSPVFVRVRWGVVGLGGRESTRRDPHPFFNAKGQNQKHKRIGCDYRHAPE